MGNLAKRKKTSHFNKENKAPGEEQDEPDSDVEECLENNDSSMEQSEIIQTSPEEAESVLPEQQANSCENEPDAEHESEQASGNTANSRSEEGNKDTECSEKSKGCNGDLTEHFSNKDTNGK